MVSVDEELCTSCGVCIDSCPVEAISFDDNQIARIDQDVCEEHKVCIDVCPVDAISES